VTIEAVTEPTAADYLENEGCEVRSCQQEGTNIVFRMHCNFTNSANSALTVATEGTDSRQQVQIAGGATFSDELPWIFSARRSRQPLKVRLSVSGDALHSSPMIITLQPSLLDACLRQKNP
jgi:hypothetical protein